jgi:hypothetical protein
MNRDVKIKKLFILPDLQHSPESVNLGSGHYLWRGVAPKRKGLGKQNFE